VYLWNEAIRRGVDRLDADDLEVTEAFDVIRNHLLLPYWKRKVMFDLSQWLAENNNRMTPKEYKKIDGSRKASDWIRRNSHMVEMGLGVIPILLEMARRIQTRNQGWIGPEVQRRASEMRRAPASEP
jgi:hypothetical protein